MVCSVAL